VRREYGVISKSSGVHSVVVGESAERLSGEADKLTAAQRMSARLRVVIRG